MTRVHVALIVVSAAFFALAFFPGCYCWQASHRNEPACVVVHQVIDCTVDTAKDLTPAVAGIVMTYLQGTTEPDWAALLLRLESMGLRDAGCVLAQVENDFMRPSVGPKLDLARAARSKDFGDRFLAWKLTHGLTGVKFKLPDGGLR